MAQRQEGDLVGTLVHISGESNNFTFTLKFEQVVDYSKGVKTKSALYKVKSNEMILCTYMFTVVEDDMFFTL